MPFKDFELYSIADADAGKGIRGLIRTLRRTMKRCWLDRETIRQPRVFCQNIGGCGSTYMVQLLSDNGIQRVFHEKAPDLNEIGVEHFVQPITTTRLIRLLRYTRHNVFFEANNRLFTMSQELALAFPNSKFVHLFRDPIDSVRSNMSKPNVDTYVRSNPRLQTAIGGPSDASPFEKFCHHWRNGNQRIFDDLQAIKQRTGIDSLTIGFKSLIEGQLKDFESFAGIKLENRVRPPVNRRATRAAGKFPPFAQWTSDQQVLIEQVCGPLHRTLQSLEDTM